MKCQMGNSISHISVKKIIDFSFRSFLNTHLCGPKRPQFSRVSPKPFHFLKTWKPQKKKGRSKEGSQLCDQRTKHKIIPPSTFKMRTTKMKIFLVFLCSMKLASGFTFFSPAENKTEEEEIERCEAGEGVRALNWDPTCKRYFACVDGLWNVRSCQPGTVIDLVTGTLS